MKILKYMYVGLAILGCGIVRAQETNPDIRTEAEEVYRASGLALEPMLIYSQDEAKIRTSQLPIISEDTDASVKGMGLGLKVGAHAFESFVLGADLRYSRSEMSDSSYGKAKGDKFTLGPTVLVQMPVAGLRAWATGVLAGSYDPSAGAMGFDVRFRDPRGVRVGVGFHIKAVSLNLEYEDVKFRNTKVTSYGILPGNATSGVDFDTRGYSASVSFPMEI